MYEIFVFLRLCFLYTFTKCKNSCNHALKYARIRKKLSIFSYLTFLRIETGYKAIRYRKQAFIPLHLPIAFYSSFLNHGIMSLDIIPARSEAEWPSSPEGSHVRRTWYNVVRHYTGPERSGVAISPKGPYPEDML